MELALHRFLKRYKGGVVNPLSSGEGGSFKKVKYIEQKNIYKESNIKYKLIIF